MPTKPYRAKAAYTKLTGKQITKKVDALRQHCLARDKVMKDVLAARDGDYETLAPGMLPPDFDKALVSNLVDTAARDVSEVMAPLPTVQCLATKQNSDRAKKFAATRAKIGQSYPDTSRLQDQMYGGCDRYASFGWMAYVVSPDYDDEAPVIRVDDALSAYYLLDSRGRTKCYATTGTAKVSELVYLYPEYATILNSLLPRYYVSEPVDKDVSVYHYYDDVQLSVIIPEADNLQILHVDNPIGRCPVRIVQRPELAPGHARGQFDDVLWVQVARAMVASYTMSALEQSVNSPIVVPNDVTEMTIGPLETLQTDNPAGVGRVPLNIPQGVFPEQQMLAMEQLKGSRYPEGRSGNIDASVITGQGVQALMGTFDTQIQTFQTLNATALEDVISMCFEMDQALWPKLSKTIRGRDDGSPYEITYTPSDDIASDFTCTITYGAIAGLDPNRGLVFLLQAVAGGLISKDTARRYMPVDLNVTAEMQTMEIEMMRDSLTASIAAMAQAIPNLVAQGMDAGTVVVQFADILKMVQRGSSIEEAVSKVLAPKQAEAPAGPDLAALLGAGGGGPPGAGGPEAQPGRGPVGTPSAASTLLMQLAGSTPSGRPNLQSTVSRQTRVA